MYQQQEQQLYNNDNILFRGWILTHEAINAGDINVLNNQQQQLQQLQIKWTPKFIIVNKIDKNILLFDNEPSKITCFNHSDNDDDIINYRVDSPTTKDSFINYWKHKCLLNLEQYQQPYGFNRDLSPLRENINHHLSNKEIESVNYDNDSTKESKMNTETPSATSAFRLLFFKKSAPKQNTSLKRAKSGIQLDRKKLNFNTTTSTPTTTVTSSTSSSSSSGLSSSSTTSTSATVNTNGILNPNYNNTNNDNVNNKSSLPTSIRPSRSHECLSPTLPPQGILNNEQILFIDNSFENNNDKTIISNNNTNEANLIKIDLNNVDLKQVNSVHGSLLSQDNCFEIKYEIKDDHYKKRYFLCRTTDERDKWIFILKYLLNSNHNYERRYENTLQLWILEAKGGCISSTSSSNKGKKYFCEIFLNNSLYGRTCLKEKKDLLFWGENFDFNTLKSEHLRIELFHDSIESSKKKKKDSLKPPNNLLGFIHIPLNTVEASQPVERWYRVESSNELLTTSLSLSSSSGTISSSNTLNSNYDYMNSSSKTTTHDLNNGKDSILVRVKAKYNCVDILPLTCYNKLINYIQENYLKLLQTLEPHLNVRTKDDLSNTLVRITYKMQIIKNYLNDLIISEILDLEDTSLIFRGNSLATKSMESYLKLVGESYLKYTLCDIVKSIIETNHDLEIDPSKVTNQNSLQSNREELIQILHLVCGRVFNSCNHFPKELKSVFCLLRENCLKNGKSDEMCDMLISASIFLRFICPAILSPNLFNLTQEYPQEKAARKLTLAAKTLQTIANFSKFGGKEFYMSFDKMNKFVDEHTILMREFLRNISTNNDNSNLSSNHSSTDSLATTSTSSSIIDNPQPNSENYTSDDNSNNTNSRKEIPFNCDLIDFGKQLSILHTLLINIISTLDKSVIEKLNPLNEILNEISHLKQTVKFNELMIPTVQPVMQQKSNNEFHKPVSHLSPSVTNPNINVIHEANNSSNQTIQQIVSPSTASLAAAFLPTARLIVYDNLYHHAIMNKEQRNEEAQQEHQHNNLNNETSIPIKIVTAALDGINSVTNVIEKKLLNNSSNDNTSNLTLSNDSSSLSSPPSPSLTYSSEATINLVNVKPVNNQKENQTPITDQLNHIMKRLSETELELKKEQEDKLLLEMKYKQQEQEHEQQMRSLINRLIKVEEELKREKIEMNKLLKAKQEIIDVQKKRIEGMASRLAHTQFQQQQQLRYNSSNSNKHRLNHNHNHHNPDQLNGNSNPTHHQQQQPNHQLKINPNITKTLSTPISSSITATPMNNDLRNHHHVNHVTLNTTHFLRTSEL